MLDWSNPSKIIALSIKASGLNNTQFRKAVGLSHVQLWRLMRNRCKPQAETRSRIEAFLDSLVSSKIDVYQKSFSGETLSDGVQPKIGRAA